MVLEKLGSVLRKTTDKIANAVFLDKNLVDGIVKDLQRSLIEADVNVGLVMELSKKIKQAAVDERLKGVEKKEHIIKLLHDEIVMILGKKRDLVLGKWDVFLLVGLYGAGKTTTIGKLATYYSKRGKKVCAVGLDVHRPAAPEQLKQICDKAKIDCFIDAGEKDPLKIWKKFENEFKKYSLVIVDSAGRDALDKELISEIKKIAKVVKATESFLVMQADIGQAAKEQARAFKDAAGVTGVIITRMDSTAKAGGALTACAEVEAPVVFIGTGETPADLETFDPESFLSRLLGMGDLKTLMEKIHSVMDEKEIQRQQEKLQSGKFTLRDLQTQLEGMEGLGSMDKVLGMIPGLGKVKDKIGEGALEGQQAKVKKWKHAINSMTEEEIENPEILEKQTSRIQRIAKGAGCSTSDIRMLIKQWKMLKEMIKSQGAMIGGKMDQKMIMKLARKFGRKMRM
ncbi:MAG: signal recognition particle receptor subunit alpha [Nanoarchaeota archaeon]|nr:signal recognition particle receptor subunit alpha [Nanoarchaeota archaeon]MBU1103377.1 signal recognition particle receptor subunit alpha [Nanoarchaeota archaeon]